MPPQCYLTIYFQRKILKDHSALSIWRFMVFVTELWFLAKHYITHQLDGKLSVFDPQANLISSTSEAWKVVWILAIYVAKTLATKCTWSLGFCTCTADKKKNIFCKGRNNFKCFSKKNLEEMLRGIIREW